MRFSIRRKINLGKYGQQFAYESIDIAVDDADSWDEAEKEVKSQMIKIHDSYTKKVTPYTDPFSQPVTFTDEEIDQLPN